MHDNTHDTHDRQVQTNAHCKYVDVCATFQGGADMLRKLRVPPKMETAADWN